MKTLRSAVSSILLALAYISMAPAGLLELLARLVSPDSFPEDLY